MHPLAALALAIALCALACRAYYPEDVFSDSDASRVQQALLAKQKDSKWGDAYQTNLAVATLTGLNAKVPDADKLCGKLNGLLTKTSEVQTVADVVQAAENLKCGTALPASAVKVISTALSSDALLSVYNAVSAISAAAANGHTNMQEFDLSALVPKVLELAEDEGLFRSSVASDEANAYNTGLAYSVLGSVFNAVEASVKEQIVEHATSKLEDFLSNRQISGLPAVSSVVRGLKALSAALSEQLTIPASPVVSLCRVLVEQKFAQGIEESFLVVTGLKVCADNKFNVPLVASVVAPAANSLAPTALRVTNVMDKFAVKVKVQIQKSEDDEPVALVAGSEPTFQLGIAKWAPGTYSVRVSITPQGDQEEFHSQHQTVSVKVSTSVKLEKTDVFVLESSKLPSTDPADIARCVFPNALTMNVVASTGKFVHFKLYIAGNANVQPAQVFLRLSREKSGKSAYFVATAASASLYVLRVEAGSAEMVDALRALGDGDSKFHMEWIVGDAVVTQSLTWSIGQIELPALPKNSVKSKTEKVESELSLKPEISHAFRTPEERPWTVIAMLFTALAVAPLLFVLVKLMSMKVSFNWPASAEMFNAALFHATILTILGLYVCYWIKLNIFQALIMSSILGVIAVVSGQKALRALHVRTVGAKLKAL